MVSAVMAESVASSERATVDFAEKVFGSSGRFFGPSVIERLFPDIEVPDVHTLPFTRRELEHASDLGQRLVFAPYGQTMWDICEQRENRTSCGGPIVSGFQDKKGKDFFCKDCLGGEWWLIGEVIRGSTFPVTSYFYHTSVLAEHLSKAFGQDPPNYLPEVLSQFEEKKGEIGRYAQTKPELMFELLTNLDINKLFRPSPVLLFWFSTLCELANKGTRILSHARIWTNHRVIVGKKPRQKPWLLSVGCFGQETGIQTVAFDPWTGGDNLCTCFAWRGVVV